MEGARSRRNAPKTSADLHATNGTDGLESEPASGEDNSSLQSVLTNKINHMCAGLVVAVNALLYVSPKRPTVLILVVTNLLLVALFVFENLDFLKARLSGKRAATVAKRKDKRTGNVLAALAAGPVATVSSPAAVPSIVSRVVSPMHASSTIKTTAPVHTSAITAPEQSISVASSHAPIGLGSTSIHPPHRPLVATGVSLLQQTTRDVDTAAAAPKARDDASGGAIQAAPAETGIGSNAHAAVVDQSSTASLHPAPTDSPIVLSTAVDPIAATVVIGDAASAEKPAVAALPISMRKRSVDDTDVAAMREIVFSGPSSSSSPPSPSGDATLNTLPKPVAVSSTPTFPLSGAAGAGAVSGDGSSSDPVPFTVGSAPSQLAAELEERKQPFSDHADGHNQHHTRPHAHRPAVTVTTARVAPDVDEPSSAPSHVPPSKLPLAGSSIKMATDQYAQSKLAWKLADARTFSVRTGPDYYKKKLKSPSLDALYDVFAVDWYKSPKKVDCITDVVHVPSISDALMMLKNSTRPDIDVDTAARELTALAADANCPFPPIFVLNMAAPTYAPANPLWGKAVEDGPSVSLILYLLLNEHGRAAIQKRSPAGRLLQRFVDECFEDSKMADRFKGILRVENYEHLSIASFVKKHNSKPFLTRPQHEFYRGDTFVEAFVDVHTFSYLARKGLDSYIQPLLKELVLTFAIVIEAREEDEMPEQVCWAVTLHGLDYKMAAIMPNVPDEPKKLPHLH